jgi:hypothetical protein
MVAAAFRQMRATNWKVRTLLTEPGSSCDTKSDHFARCAHPAPDNANG